MSDEKNCFHIRHVVSSTIICAFSCVVTVGVFAMGIACPLCIHILYKLGGSDVQVSVAAGVLSGIALLVNLLFGIGIKKESAILILVWLLVTFILWQLHLILVICTFMFNLTSAEDKCTSYCSVRLIGISFVQILWLVMLILVGRHWYALCEDLYIQEYGTRPVSMSVRLRSISHRRRVPTGRVPLYLRNLDR